MYAFRLGVLAKFLERDGIHISRSLVRIAYMKPCSYFLPSGTFEKIGIYTTGNNTKSVIHEMINVFTQFNQRIN